MKSYNLMLTIDNVDKIERNQLVMDNFDSVVKACIVISNNGDDTYTVIKNRWGKDGVVLNKTEYLTLMGNPQAICENL